MLTLWTAEQLAKHRFEHVYLLDPCVPQGGILFLHGKRAIGKTQLLMSLCAAVTEGGRWYGKYQATKGSVVYVQSDMSPAIQQDRLLKAQSLYPLTNIHFLFPTFFNIAALTVNTPLVEQIRALQPKLIIWDTLRKIFRGDIVGDDSSASFVYGKAQELFPGVTHCFAHHDKKTVAEQEQLDDDELFRGSGAWIDDADTGIHLTKVAGGRLMLRFTKVRTCEEQPPIPLVMHPETLLLYSSGDQARQLADAWRYHHPQGRPEDLERYLLSSFVGTPRVAHFLAFGEDANPPAVFHPSPSGEPTFPFSPEEAAPSGQPKEPFSGGGNGSGRVLTLTVNEPTPDQGDHHVHKVPEMPRTGRLRRILVPPVSR